jgi:hypothetical protein
MQFSLLRVSDKRSLVRAVLGSYNTGFHNAIRDEVIRKRAILHTKKTGFHRSSGEGADGKVF